MSKPNIDIPSGFAENGTKEDFPNDKILNGFDPINPDILPGDCLNKFIDDTYKGLNGVLELYDTKVNKTGDTMTGRLSINLSDLNSIQQSAYIVRDTSVEFGTPPSSNMYDGMLVIADSNSNRMGRLEYVLNSDGSHYLSLVDKKNSSESVYSYIRVGFDANGNRACSFPDTTCVDGQWQPDATSIATNVNINGNSNLTYDLSASIPKDGYCYELLLWARVVTTITATAYVPIYVGSSLTADTYLPVCGMKAVNNVSNTSIGSTILPLGTDRKITLVRNAGYYGTLEALAVKAIRRIGTNS